MREIVLDTETTGLDPVAGHRMVEIGPVEVVNCSLTGQTFHRYLCSQRAMPADALAMHELTAEFLADKPLFGAVADERSSAMRRLSRTTRALTFAFLNVELKERCRQSDRRTGHRAGARHRGDLARLLASVAGQ
jgi:DNA polymerase III subunit epsilon